MRVVRLIWRYYQDKGPQAVVSVAESPTMTTNQGISNTPCPHLEKRGDNSFASFAKFPEGAKSVVGGATKMVGGATRIVGGALRMTEKLKG